MILVVSSNGDILTLHDLKAMRLPIRHGWEAWLHQDEAGMRTRYPNYAAALAAELRRPCRKRTRKK